MTFLESFLIPGAPVNMAVARSVYGLSKEFEKRNLGPSYRQVGAIITEVFGNHISEKIRHNDSDDWARKTAKRYEKLLENRQQRDRALKHYVRGQIDKFPPLRRVPKPPPPPSEPTFLTTGKHLGLSITLQNSLTPDNLSVESNHSHDGQAEIIPPRRAHYQSSRGPSENHAPEYSRCDPTRQTDRDSRRRNIPS